MSRYRSRSRSYSPGRRSRTPPRARERYDDEDRHLETRSYRDRRSSAPSGLLIRNLSLDARSFALSLFLYCFLTFSTNQFGLRTVFMLPFKLLTNDGIFDGKCELNFEYLFIQAVYYYYYIFLIRLFCTRIVSIPV